MTHTGCHLVIKNKTLAKFGDGFFPRHRLDMVHVAFLNMDNFCAVFKMLRSGSTIPASITMSLHSGLSPAIFPNAQIACSLTSSYGDSNNRMKMGTAPQSITVLVWWELPDAMFVRAHAASNWRVMLFSHIKKSFKIGTTPVLITSSIGGLFSETTVC